MTPNTLPTDHYDAQLTEKVTRLANMMTPFAAPEIEAFRSPASHYRMRAEFRVWHDEDDLYHIMFDQQTKQRIRVDQFPAASELINRLMSVMMDELKPNHALRFKLFQIDYLSTMNNKVVVSLLYHRKLDDEWKVEAEALRDRCVHKVLTCSLLAEQPKQKSVSITTMLMNAYLLLAVT